MAQEGVGEQVPRRELDPLDELADAHRWSNSTETSSGLRRHLNFSSRSGRSPGVFPHRPQASVGLVRPRHSFGAHRSAPNSTKACTLVLTLGRVAP